VSQKIFSSLTTEKFIPAFLWEKERNKNLLWEKKFTKLYLKLFYKFGISGAVHGTDGIFRGILFRGIIPRHFYSAELSSAEFSSAELSSAELIPRYLFRGIYSAPNFFKKIIPRNNIPRNIIPRNFIPQNFIPRNFIPRNFIPRNFIPRKFILLNFILLNFIPKKFSFFLFWESKLFFWLA